jgi:hypothetical protein
MSISSFLFVLIDVNRGVEVPPRSRTTSFVRSATPSGVERGCGYSAALRKERGERANHRWKARLNALGSS